MRQVKTQFRMEWICPYCHAANSMPVEDMDTDDEGVVIFPEDLTCVDCQQIAERESSDESAAEDPDDDLLLSDDDDEECE